MKEYDVPWIREALLKISDVMAANRDILTEIDSKSGDGDLGISMEKGAAAIRDTVDSFPDSGKPAMLLAMCGMAFNKAAPSTMGTLIGMSLMALGRSLGDKMQISEEEIVAVPKTIADTIAKAGKSKQGDKTILDALCPFADSLAENYSKSGDLPSSWAEAAKAARAGMESTRGMVAKVGRARWLGERASEVVDGGAFLCCAVIDAFLA